MGAAKIFPEGRTTRKCPKGVTFKLFKNIWQLVIELWVSILKHNSATINSNFNF
jgi:hypothetical protein